MAGKIAAVIDGQFGSTGKGVIVSHLARQYGMHVRVGSPNAGHSHKIRPLYENPKTWVNQIIPVGWVNTNAVVALGRGALINPRIFRKEMDEIATIDPSIWNRTIVDSRAGVLSPWHEEAEGHTEGELHKRIGSTGEGVGAARIDRLKRVHGEGYFLLWQDIAAGDDILQDITVDSVAKMVSNYRRNGVNVLLEGAQGFGLDVVHGTWPYCTTASTGAAGLCADVGVPPHHITDVIMVVRTYPIRVAGNSGPLKDEITWEQLSEEVGRHIEPEKTTVTKKVRRIGRWDWNLMDQAVTVNSPTCIALTFVDYLAAEDEGVTSYGKLSEKSRQFIDQIESRYGIPVDLIGTGGPNWAVIDRR